MFLSYAALYLVHESAHIVSQTKFSVHLIPLATLCSVYNKNKKHTLTLVRTLSALRNIWYLHLVVLIIHTVSNAYVLNLPKLAKQSLHMLPISADEVYLPCDYFLCCTSTVSLNFTCFSCSRNVFHLCISEGYAFICPQGSKTLLFYSHMKLLHSGSVYYH